MKAKNYIFSFLFVFFINLLKLNAINVMVEDFESYTNNTHLSNTWILTAPPSGPYPREIYTNHTYVVEGNKSLRWLYDCHGGDNYITFTFKANQDWSQYTKFVMWYKGWKGSNPPPNNSGEYITFQLKDEFGGLIHSTNTAPNKVTQLSDDWQKWEINISGWEGLDKVRKIVIFIKAVDYGGGEMFFDNFYLKYGCDPVYISNFTPTSGIPGTTVTVRGYGFGDNQGSGVVKFGGIDAVDYISWSDTNIVVKVPTDAQTGLITVQNSCGNYANTSSSFIVIDLNKKCQIGAFVDQNDDGTTQAEIDNFENLIGKNLANVMFYKNWGNGTNNNFPLQTFNLIKNNGSVPWLKWDPWLDGLGNGVSIIDNILGGYYDSYITNFAISAKNWGEPFWLDFAHEMNGNWYGWSGDKNGGASGVTKYTQMWHKVRRIFDSVGATNMAWVISYNAVSFPNQSWNTPKNYYPGDEYVDWIGIDGYNWFTNDFGVTNIVSFNEIFSNLNATIPTISSNKKVVISEMGCAEYTEKSNWIMNAFSYMMTLGTNIKAFNWFNVIKERDWRINSPSAGKAMSNAMIPDYFTSYGNPKPKKSLPYIESLIEGFETYNNTKELEKYWRVALSDPVRTLETVEVKYGTKALRWDYTCKFYGDEALFCEFKEPQDWSMVSYIGLWYKGISGNSGEYLRIELYDDNDTLIGGTTATSKLTKITTWSKWEVNISSWNGGNGLGKVKKIKLIIVAGDWKNGTIYIDHIYVKSQYSIPSPIIAEVVIPNAGQIKIYPNPSRDGKITFFSGGTKISVTVYDLNKRKIWEYSNNSNNKIEWNWYESGIGTGVYLAVISDGNNKITRLFTIIR